MGRWIAAVLLAVALGFGLGWLVKPVPAALSTTAEKPKAQLWPEQGAPVATFDGGVLTDDELRAFIATAAPEQKPTVEDALLVEVASARAIEGGATADPLLAARLKRALAEAFQNEKLDELAKTTAQDEAGLKQWYEAHRGEFVRPERIVVQHVVINAVAGKEKDALAKARSLETASDADAFRAEGTRLGVVNERAFSLPELESELGKDNAAKAFPMVRVGQVQTFAVGTTVHALRLIKREGPLDVPFEQARAQVASRRWYELRAAALERMRSELISGAKVDQAAAEGVLKR